MYLKNQFKISTIHRKIAYIVFLLGVLLSCSMTMAGVIVVSEIGGDFTSIQSALNAAEPGDSILVRQKKTAYSEKLHITKGGNASHGFVSIIAYPGEHPVIDGSRVQGADLIRITNCNYVRIRGFELRNNLNVQDGSGIRVVGYGSFIEILHNVIHDIRGTNAMGITVYGTEILPISNLTIDGNKIYDCEPAPSEAIVLNGNVTDFIVANNLVLNVNNIGIDFIGGEKSINQDPALVARNGICRSNQVYSANSTMGGGYAAGIYVDGGRNIIVENNIVTGCDLGIEIGAENAGIVTSGIIVRNNVVFANDKVGIIFGGYKQNLGEVRACSILNNTCYKNDTLAKGWGEIVIQFAEDNIVKNNIFFGTGRGIILYSEAGNNNNSFNYNLWYYEPESGEVSYVWRGTAYNSFDSFQKESGQGAQSRFGDPLFRNQADGDFHISKNSPAVDMGDPAFYADSNEVDIDNEVRISGNAIDAGADEVQVPCHSGD